MQFAPTRKKVEALSGKIVKVSGPLVVATGLKDANMADVVRVGEQRLIGEILNMNGDAASIQVYEETSGPVSYTHLDVYKRQALRLDYAAVLAHTFSLAAACDLSVIHS